MIYAKPKYVYVYYTPDVTPVRDEGEGVALIQFVFWDLEAAMMHVLDTLIDSDLDEPLMWHQGMDETYTNDTWTATVTLPGKQQPERHVIERVEVHAS